MAGGGAAVNARQKIHDYLRPVLTEVGRVPIDEYLDAYAHELAEAIRVWANGRDIDEDGWVGFNGADEAADLIDPEVEL